VDQNVAVSKTKFAISFSKIKIALFRNDPSYHKVVSRFLADHSTLKLVNIIDLEYWDVVINLCPVSLCYTFRYPHYISTFLFFKFEE